MTLHTIEHKKIAPGRDFCLRFSIQRLQKIRIKKRKKGAMIKTIFHYI